MAYVAAKRFRSWLAVVLFGAVGSLVLVPTAAPEASPPALVGRWEAPFDGEIPAVNLVLLHDGRLLYWSGLEADTQSDDPTWMEFFKDAPHAGTSRVLDLSGPSPVVVTPPHADGAAGDLFCSGNQFLPDGRVVAIGATNWAPGTPNLLFGGPDARVFDPDTTDWTRVADMNLARWYPSLIALPDGRPMAASGIDTLTNFLSHQEKWETYDAGADAWGIVDGADRLLPLYPRLTVVPGGPMKGDVFYNTVGALWGHFGEHPLEAPWSLQQVYDPTAREWTVLGPSVFGVRNHAASVMLPLDPANGHTPTFLTFGGTLQRTGAATPLAETVTLDGALLRPEPAAPTHHARWHPNGVLLPDGHLLAVGGVVADNTFLHAFPDVPVLPAELYDPATGRWTEVAPMIVTRGYHSTAVLLPDGRVLVGGHAPHFIPFKAVRDATGMHQPYETRFEIYEPPYLFRGDRPTITDVPDALAYGERFTAEVAGLGLFDSAYLIHPGATTHAFDMAQRAVRLDVVAGDLDDRVILRAPPDATVAPPGHYMLFVNRASAGGPVPSVAEFVRLG